MAQVLKSETSIPLPNVPRRCTLTLGDHSHHRRR
jgi:hypothetical protein